MKRILSILLILLVLAVTTAQADTDVAFDRYHYRTKYQYFALGTFPQTASGESQDIKWRILDVEKDCLLLLSEYVLFNSRVDSDYLVYDKNKGRFDTTELYRLLNGPFERVEMKESEEKLRERGHYGYAYVATESFYDSAFTDLERSYILEDPELGNVFLLTSKEVKRDRYGLGYDFQRQATCTDYARSLGTFEYMDGSCAYWTRSKADKEPGSTRCIKKDGVIGFIRCIVMNEGIRPAIRLRIPASTDVDGIGTFDNPFRLEDIP